MVAGGARPWPLHDREGDRDIFNAIRFQLAGVGHKCPLEDKEVLVCPLDPSRKNATSSLPIP